MTPPRSRPKLKVSWWRRLLCRVLGHAIGPLHAGPRYVANGIAQFDLYMFCGRCARPGGIARGIAYTWKGHRALHNGLQGQKAVRP